MIRYTTGNLLDAPVEALVNTVNTVGVMGKGIALMFKERFPANMRAYAEACKQGDVVTGKMFITQTGELLGPRWIVNFPTKQHWRNPAQMAWIQDGLQDLRAWLQAQQVSSIAIPPLGAGNGGLPWPEVKQAIETALGDLDIDILLYEPSSQYQNVAKRGGVAELTPARALIAELVRRYWFLGMECSLLEIQKLAWFLARVIGRNPLGDPLQLQFKAHRYGPYANNLTHLLNAMDGSYLQSDKRIPDSKPFDVIWFNEAKKQELAIYLQTEAKAFLPILEQTTALIDGFESPYGMELLATVDWLIAEEGCAPTLSALREGLHRWPAGTPWGECKARLFDDRSLQIALTRLQQGLV
ncbi:MAG: type II toxin-antitoxin system antitoxin DNA ADP-ribosyl glycohydrolase DarG [Aeromonas veronii]